VKCAGVNFGWNTFESNYGSTTLTRDKIFEPFREETKLAFFHGKHKTSRRVKGCGPNLAKTHLPPSGNRQKKKPQNAHQTFLRF